MTALTSSVDGGSARVRVALDLRHPLAYLALGPARVLAEELGGAVDWLPLRVPSLRPPSEPAAGDDRGARHRRYRAQAIAREIETYAAVQEIVVRDFYREGGAGAVGEAADQAWLWVRDRYPARLPDFLTELFRAYWAADLDPADPDVVAACVEEFGADGSGFRSWYGHAGRVAAEALAAELREFGLFQVPAFVVEDEVFYGRQHLPMIRWILGGRRGTAPA